MKLCRKAKRQCWQRVSGVLALTLLFSVAPVYPAQSPTREYQLENQVFPEKVIEVTAVRNLQSPHFPSDLEVEVKNISSKPLYHIHFNLRFKHTLIAVPLLYGDSRLFDLASLSGKEDIPIGPGTTQVLRVPSGNGLGTEKAIANGKLPFEATLNCRLFFQRANFGDGSGYILKDYYPAEQ